MPELIADLPAWTLGWVVIAAAAVIGLLFQVTAYGLLTSLGRRRPEILIFDGLLLHHSRSGARLLIPLLFVRSALPIAALHLPAETIARLHTTLGILLVFAVTWLAIRLTRVVEEMVYRRFDIDVADNLRARQVRTRVALLRRVVVAALLVIGAGLLLLQVPGFRTVGTGLLASAGVLGIIVGVAAQRPLANLLAGIQIALTQPFRADDAVLVEGEWGRIEEITLTYVVVRLWDLRRLVLPISYFLEKPFQNWTRTSASLLGSVFIYADYTVPVDVLRTELERLVKASPLWDRQVCVLQVTDLTERSVQLRALVSAATAADTWDLRAHVREAMVGFLQREHPSALPRLRIEGDGAVPGRESGARA